MVDVQDASAQAASVGKPSPGEVLAMAGVLARAFHDDPAFSWVLRTDPRRMKILDQEPAAFDCPRLFHSTGHLALLDFECWIKIRV